MHASFPDGEYRDVPGLCRAVAREEISSHGWSLNPGRYVGTTPGEIVDDEDFKIRLESLQEEVELLNSEATALQARIAQNVADILAQP
jgi:type I restriction enzyme M protein